MSVVFTIWKIHVQVDSAIRQHHSILIYNKCAWSTCVCRLWKCRPASGVVDGKTTGAKSSLGTSHTIKQMNSIDTRIVQKICIHITYHMYISSIHPFPFAVVNYSSCIWILKPAYKYRKLTAKSVRERAREEHTKQRRNTTHNNRMRINFDEFMDISHSMDEQNCVSWKRVEESESERESTILRKRQRKERLCAHTK